MDIFYSKTEITEERITELEDRSEENTQNGTQNNRKVECIKRV